MNHREKKRKLVITTLSIISIVVLSLTIAYAALSETLTILTPKKEKKYDNAISKADNLSWIFG